ncbi:hypothetical protein [Salinibacter phage M8CRM-1]|uniref:Uncharacterized protein n=3 Tax=Kryptosalinivirus TaxID=2560163 RepID=A0A2I6UGC5_9CAUD|nr:hypothetical protein FGG63_gp44 [Salinibacter phage M8CC-19]YP_009639512.1 hypothetical protein FGG67_gp46 [Salinibacter phage M8CRM-1]AUO79020.1 hypothetical protein [Salinibacter phage M8CC-19]AUO79181.1 hypothetical protein [Salinibacter phage M8CRM-1]AUO79253.1 hypothetical protein [Salinibacter phage M31CC-1]
MTKNDKVLVVGDCMFKDHRGHVERIYGDSEDDYAVVKVRMFTTNLQRTLRFFRCELQLINH